VEKILLPLAIRLRDSFASRIEWRVNGNWLWWNDLSFSLSAPVGHLPSWRFGGSGGVWGCFVTVGGLLISRQEL
jgi:hypothetical protein